MKDRINIAAPLLVFLALAGAGEAAETRITWTRGADMLDGRGYFGAIAVEGQIYVAGGQQGCPTCALGKAEVYEPASDSWHPINSMPTHRFGHAVVPWQGGFLVIAGRAESVFRDDVIRYDVGLKQWFPFNIMTPIAFFGAAANGAPMQDYQAHVFGGYDNTLPGDTNHVWRYENMSGWQDMGTRLTQPRQGIAAAFVNGKYYLFGGSGPMNFRDVQEYNPVNNMVTFRCYMKESRSYAAAVAADGLVFVIGGSGDAGPVKTVEVYDPRTNTCTELAPLAEPRVAPGVAAIGRKIYVMGGMNGGNPLNTIEIGTITDNKDMKEGDIRIIPNVLDVSRKTSSISFVVQGEAGKGVEIIIFNLSGRQMGILRGETDDKGVCVIPLAPQDPKLELSPGAYVAAVRGDKIGKRRAFMVSRRPVKEGGK